MPIPRPLTQPEPKKPSPMPQTIAPSRRHESMSARSTRSRRAMKNLLRVSGRREDTPSVLTTHESNEKTVGTSMLSSQRDPRGVSKAWCSSATFFAWRKKAAPSVEAGAVDYIRSIVSIPRSPKPWRSTWPIASTRPARAMRSSGDSAFTTEQFWYIRLNARASS